MKPKVYSSDSDITDCDLDALELCYAMLDNFCPIPGKTRILQAGKVISCETIEEGLEVKNVG